MDGKRLISETNTLSYQQNFRGISNDLNNSMDLNEWIALFKKLNFWERQLEMSDENMSEIFGEDFKPTKDMMIRFLKEMVKEYPHSFSYVVNNEVVTVTKNHIIKFTNFENNKLLSETNSRDIEYGYYDDEVDDCIVGLYENVLDYLNSTIKSINLPGISFDTPQQMLVRGKVRKFKPATNVQDILTTHEATVNFRSVDSDLNYWILFDIIIKHYLNTDTNFLKPFSISVVDITPPM